MADRDGLEVGGGVMGGSSSSSSSSSLTAEVLAAEAQDGATGGRGRSTPAGDGVAASTDGKGYAPELIPTPAKPAGGEEGAA